MTKLERLGVKLWTAFWVVFAACISTCAYSPTPQVFTSAGLVMDIAGVIAIAKSSGAWNAGEHPGAKTGLWFLGIGFSMQILAQWI